ncbi:HTH gntR-type domain-containing protein [Bordetella sputigena]|uniref:GntR family transcriptional regulator n=1 Tax=Bordetella sputigena TaxID=1416810 RepID=UPI0039EEC82B
MTEATATPRSSRRRGDASGFTARSLPEQVADKLLQAILDGEIPSGARLPEIALAEEYKVSRATIRDALAQLERHHFVEKLPRFGCRVIEVDMAEIAELYELRAMLLGLASARAARLASQEDIDRFVEATHHLRILADNDASAAIYKREVLSAQALLIAMSNSKWVQDMYQLISNQSLWRVMVRGKSVVFGSKERRQQSATDWTTLARTVAQRDPAASEAAARALIGASWDYVRERRSGK